MDKASKRENTISDQKRQGIARIIPPYAVIPLLSCLAWNCIVYWGTQVLCANRPHYDFSTPFDLALPFQSWWILIYVSSFVFWPLCYVMTAKYNSKEFLFRFVTQFTKQHYIVDVAGGLLTALLAFALGMRTNWYRPVQRMFERVNQRVWRDMGETHER